MKKLHFGKNLVALSLAFVMVLCTMTVGLCETLTGEAEGYGGAIKATVSVEDGAITGLLLTGEGETPAIGGAALETLMETIVAAGTVDGVDGVAGATWTSNGVFAAVRNAMGVEEAAPRAGRGYGRNGQRPVPRRWRCFHPAPWPGLRRGERGRILF